MIRFVAAASSSIEVKGICAALTDIPRDSNSEMTFAQLEPSAISPTTMHQYDRRRNPSHHASFLATREDEVREDCDQVTAHRLAAGPGARDVRQRERGVTISGTTAGLR